ncbi:type IV pilus assembly protein PilY1 [Pseudoxanthomonas sp. CF385]|nr:type IV pilus assembly protein PilY1 [Pseudoxanthomonas sp. CF385]
MESNMKKFATVRPLKKVVERTRAGMAAFLATLLALPAHAGIIVPNDPLQSTGRVPPNIMFILDNSTSMSSTDGWQMDNPDVTSITGGSIQSIDIRPDTDTSDTYTGIKYNTYVGNTVYYNPYVTYLPWMLADGTRRNTGMAYGTAHSDLATPTGSKNLQLLERVFYVPKAGTTGTGLSDATNYWRYVIRTNGRVVRSERRQNLNGNEGLTGVGCSTSATGWQWKNCTYLPAADFGRTEDQEKTNYAIWFSYHSTRAKAAKAGASEAFAGLGENVRVGFRTINGSSFNYNIPVGDGNEGRFSGTARTTWYQRLHNATNTGSTPLHPALAGVGQYFSDSTNTGPYGPQSGAAQYACRQNFAILTTDGYWNQSNTGYANSDNEAGPAHAQAATEANPKSFNYDPVLPYAGADASTLADVAMQYWKTDLRAGTTALDNIVPTSDENPAFWQHMVTFGISIGLRGSIDPDGPLPGQPGGAAAWPNPNDAADLHRIDDLLHAAVNSRGKFLSASNPQEFTSGLVGALNTINSRTGSYSSLGANATRLDSGTRSYQAQFTPAGWWGDLVAYPVSSAGVDRTAPIWRAADGIPATGRTVLTMDTTTNAGALFPTATQIAALGRSTAPAVSGANNAAYIAGNRTLEGGAGGLRTRVKLLGDIVNSSPAYDASTQTIYVGANDGMLHAINASNGQERFAYVPGGINLSYLAMLSDPAYEHHYFVDGPITLSTRTHSPTGTQLVGALGRGGKGIYSLDVSSPGSFNAAAVKWERYETPGSNMGLVVGQPLIANLNNGDVGVIVPNGINSAGDRAALLVYRLSDGALLAEINTGVGSAAAPNGMFSATVRDIDGNGTADYVYAGDMQGNLWRFDLRASSTTTWTNASSRVAMYTAVNDAGQRQPITAAPTVVRNPATFELWVFFGTGRFINEDDVISLQVQSLYGIKDSATAVAGRTALQRRTIATASGNSRAFEPNTPLPAGRLGWYIDLVDPPYPPGTARGERVFADPQVVAGALIVSSSTPSRDPCRPGGTGYLNALDAFTGTSLTTSLFDLDGDGIFDDETITDASGNPIPIGSVALDGMGTQGAIFTGGGGSPGGGGGGGGGLICVSISDASVECERIRELRRVGRVSWREIIRD